MAQPRPVVRPCDRLQLGGEHVPIALECRAEYVPDGVGHLRMPALAVVPRLRAGEVDERVCGQRRVEVASDLIERSRHVDLSRRPAVAYTGQVPLCALVQHPGQLPHAGEGHPGMLRLRGAQLPRDHEKVGMHALHLVRCQLDQTVVDGADRVVEFLRQQVPRHPVGFGQAVGVHGSRLAAQLGPPSSSSLVRIDRQVIGLVVIPVIAEEGGVQRAGLEASLPILLGYVTELFRSGHSCSSCLTARRSHRSLVTSTATSAEPPSPP